MELFLQKFSPTMKNISEKSMALLPIEKFFKTKKKEPF
jgi:hypothetical protein